MNDNFVFIMIRYISSELTNNYWIESYKCIREHYPKTKVIIIDDNSNETFINDFGLTFENVEFVKSEFPRRGELLPYYYFYKNKYADRAVIIHDSVFVKDKVDFENIINLNIKFLWTHRHDWNDEVNETRLLETLNNSDELLQLYDNQDSWKMCVGVMSFISHEFITKIQDTFKIFNLLDHVTTRSDRMALERVFAVLCIALEPNLNNNPSIFGIQYKWDYRYHHYIHDKQMLFGLPRFTKVFTGR